MDENKTKRIKEVTDNICSYDEGFTIGEMLEQTGFCSICKIKECPLNK